MALYELFLLVGGVLNQALCHPGVSKQNNVGIIGGHPIPIEMAPYMVSLRMNLSTPESAHFCGGSIIHEQFVLTAAHCLKQRPEFQVLVGTENITGVGGELFDVEEVLIHNEFDNKTNDYDLALIKLKEPLSFGEKIGKIHLAGCSVMQKTHPGTTLKATGWGVTETKETPSKLLQVEIPLVEHEQCKEKYAARRRNITSHMICAGSPGHQPYKGDSGGPLTLDDVQVGIVSFAALHGQIPVVFTDVSSVICWILEKITIMLK